MAASDIAAPLGTRLFEAEDQLRFAAFSGDRNPMHLDPVAARRTQAGAPVVHGVHTLLWVLERLAAARPDLPPAAGLNVRFTNMVYVGDRVEARISRSGDAALRVEAAADGVGVVTITLKLRGPAEAPGIEGGAGGLLRPLSPVDCDLDAGAGQAGRLAFFTPAAEAGMLFPAAARYLGPRRVAALAATSYLVGMVVPGLHSIYSELDLTLGPDPDPAEALAFRVADVDPRFRLGRVAVSGGGIAGMIDAFWRHPPTPQIGMAAARALLRADEFAGAVALVVGGSRGLGETTAKLIAAGGGEVILTHALGRADADAVVAEIEAGGGRARAIRLDVHADIAPQLAALAQVPTQLYYFATPTIFKRRAGVFSAARFDTFNAFYVTGFARTVEAVLARGAPRLAVLYPSSVFVDQRPANMTEYAMSKAAGEILAADLAGSARSNLRIRVHRLPRLATDQTAAVTSLPTQDTVDVLLPIIRDVQALR